MADPEAVADLEAEVERHIRRALDGLQSAAVRANAFWLPGLPVVTEQVERLERSAAAELLGRVAADRSLLAHAFNDGRDLGPLAEVDLGLSDPHNGRRTVALLRFATGQELIYKPRSVAMEAAFSRLVAWVAATAEDVAPRAPSALDRPGYGYCEHIRQRSCEDPEDVQRFYLRLGALARLLAGVRATDCHPGNVIADRDRPVLVDAETLLHPRLGATPTDPLLATEILPSTVTTSRGQTIRYGGFDDVLPGCGGRPVLDGRPRSLTDNRAWFDRGSARMDDVLRRAGPEVDAPDGPLRLAPGTRTRVVLRPTQMYGRLLAHRLSARSLAAADGGWPTTERLLRRFEDVTLWPAVWEAVRAAERAALLRTDIPYFTVDVGSGDLLDGNGEQVATQVFPAGLRARPGRRRRQAPKKSRCATP